MKILFDENDKQQAENYSCGKCLGVIPKDGTYSLNFRVTDVGKANMFLTQILMNKEIVSQLNKDAGIKITSINLYTAVPISNIKNKLQNMIEEIEFEENRLA